MLICVNVYVYLYMSVYECQCALCEFMCVCAYTFYDYQCALYEGMCVCCYLVNKSEAKSYNGSSSNQKKSSDICTRFRCSCTILMESMGAGKMRAHPPSAECGPADIFHCFLSILSQGCHNSGPQRGGI